MTPAEREALPPLDVTQEERSAIENMRPHAPRNTLLALERLACRERQLIAKMSLISSLELTLSNATKELEKTLELGAMQVGQILQTTSVIRRYREDHSCDSGMECFHSCFGDCDICKAADALLAAPTDER